MFFLAFLSSLIPLALKRAPFGPWMPMPISILDPGEQKSKPISRISVSQDLHSPLTTAAPQCESSPTEGNRIEWKGIEFCKWALFLPSPDWTALKRRPNQEVLTGWNTDEKQNKTKTVSSTYCQKVGKIFFFYLFFLTRLFPDLLSTFPREKNCPLSSRRKYIGLCGKMVLICHKNLFASSHYGQNYHYFSLVALKFF